MPELFDPNQPQNELIEPQKSFADNILPFLAGTGNQLLFGAPQAIIENLGGREAVQKYLAENKDAYGAGEVAGTIGSSFIPGLGIAGKGLKAAGAGLKALTGAEKAGKIASGITKAGEGLQKLNAVKSGAGLIGRGAAEGVLQQGTRNVISGESPLTGLVEAGAMGGLGGALGAGIGKLGKGLNEAQDTARNAVIYSATGTSPKLLKRYIKGMGVGGWGSKLENVEQKLEDLATAISGKNLAGVNLVPTTDKINKGIQWRKAIHDEYRKLDEAYKSSPDFIDKSLQSARPKVIQEVRDALSADINTDVGDIIGEADKIFSNIASKKSLVAKQMVFKNLRESLGTSYLKGEDLNKKARYLLSIKMKDALDDASAEFADMIGRPNYKQAVKEYGMMEGFLAEVLGIDEMANPGLTGGSSTFEKSQLFKAFQEFTNGEKGSLGKILGAIPGAAIAGQVINAVTPFVVNKGVAQSYKGLNKLLKNPKAQEVISKIENADIPIEMKVGDEVIKTTAKSQLGTMASTIPGLMRERNETEPEKVAQEMKSGDLNRISSSVERALDRAWNTSYARYYKNDPTAYDQFRQGAYMALSNPVTGEIDPAKAANILFPSETDRKQYLDALTATQITTQNIGRASQVPQGWASILPDFLTGAKPEDKAARGAMIDAFQKQTGIDKKEAEGIIDSILAGGGTKQQKVARIVAALEAGNPQGFEKLKALGGA